MFFQWYLFVLLMVVAAFAPAAGQTYTVISSGQREKRYKWGAALVIAIPLICLAAARSENIGDTYAYAAGFRNTPTVWAEFMDVYEKTEKDRGFVVFTYFMKYLFGDDERLYFGVIASVCLMCVVSVYRKHSCNFAMSIFLFIASSDYVQWNYNGMRQFIAVALIFAATDWLLQKKYVRYYVLILLASTIHASALIMIPMSLVVQGKPWNIQTVLITLLALIAINFSGWMNNMITALMSDTQYSGEVGQYLETEGTNVIRVLVFCIPPLMALAFRKWLVRADSKIMNLSTNMSIVSMGVYIVSAVTSGIFVGRLPIYFSLYNYILLPWLVEHVFSERSRRLVYGCLIVCYLAFYYYQMHIAWDFSAYT